MACVTYGNGLLNLEQVTHAEADTNGGITFNFTDGTSVLIGTVASTKAEAITALGLLFTAADIESYDT